MAWSDLDYQIQLKVIDKIYALSHEETNLKLSNSLVVAARELEMLSNNSSYVQADKKLIKNFTKGTISLKSPILIKTENKAKNYGIIAIFAPIGSVLGWQLTHESVAVAGINALVGAVLFGILSSYILG